MTYLKRSLLKVADSIIKKYDDQLIDVREGNRRLTYHFAEGKMYRIDYHWNEIDFNDMEIEDLASELETIIEALRNGDFLGIDKILMEG